MTARDDARKYLRARGGSDPRGGRWSARSGAPVCRRAEEGPPGLRGEGAGPLNRREPRRVVRCVEAVEVLDARSRERVRYGSRERALRRAAVRGHVDGAAAALADPERGEAPPQAPPRDGRRAARQPRGRLRRENATRSEGRARRARRRGSPPFRSSRGGPDTERTGGSPPRRTTESSGGWGGGKGPRARASRLPRRRSRLRRRAPSRSTPR